jgi:hypothetical protein
VFGRFFPALIADRLRGIYPGVTASIRFKSFAARSQSVAHHAPFGACYFFGRHRGDPLCESHLFDTFGAL